MPTSTIQGQRRRMRWTPEQEALVRLHYPALEIAQLTRMIGCTEAQLYARAAVLGVRRDTSAKLDSRATMLLELVRRPQGVAYEEVKDQLDPKQFHASIKLLMNRHHAYVAVISHRRRRYFKSKTAADAYEAANARPGRAEVSGKPISHCRAVARFDRDAEPVYAPGFRHIVAPTPPVPLRTNTHWQF